MFYCYKTRTILKALGSYPILKVGSYLSCLRKKHRMVLKTSERSSKVLDSLEDSMYTSLAFYTLKAQKVSSHAPIV